MLMLPKRALLMKLCYRKCENAARAAVTEFRQLKKQQREPKSYRDFRDMIMKFERTMQRGTLPGRGRASTAVVVKYCYSGR